MNNIQNTNKILLKLIKNILKNFIMIFFSMLILFFGFNYLFQKEELLSVEKKKVESADQIITTTKYYYVLKFVADTNYYSVEFIKGKNIFDFQKKNNNPNLLENAIIQKNNTTSTTSTYPSNNMFLPFTNFNKGDTVIIEYSIKKYPLFLESTKNFKIKGYNAKIYAKTNFQ